MSTEFFNDQWRIPSNENQNKVSNYSMDFDGTSDFINCGDSDKFSFGDGTTDRPFSLSGWVKPDSLTKFKIFGKLDGSNYEYQFGTSNSENLVMTLYSLGTSGSRIQRYYNNPLTSLDWQHWVATYDGSGNPDNIEIYINGVQVGDTSNTVGTYTAMQNTAAPLLIASESVNYANGKIDQVTVFDYALPATGTNSVATLYGGGTAVTNPMSLSPKPIAYYQLGDQSVDNGANYLVPNNSLSDYVFDFDGTDDYLTITSTDFKGSAETVSYSFWVKPETYGNPPGNQNYGYFISNSSTGGGIAYSEGGTGLGLTPGQMYLYNMTNAGAVATTTSTIIDDNVWNNIVIVFNTGNIVQFYKNGSLSSTITNVTSFSATWDTIAARRYPGGSNNPINGQLSNFSIFDTALTAPQVATLYNNGAPNDISSLNPTAWYKLNAADTFDGTNWTINDYGSGGNDGTSVGMTSTNLVASDLQQTSGYSPYALDFDGINDYLDFNNASGNIMSNKNAISISGWFKLDSNTIGAVFSNWYGGTSVQYLLRYNTSTGLGIQWYIYSNSNTTRLDTNYFPSIGHWVHVVGVKDPITNGGQSRVYINSVEYTLDSTNLSVAIANNSRSDQIGVFNNSANPMNGCISNVAYWTDTALTQAQVIEIYNQGVPSNLNTFSGTSPNHWLQIGSNSSYNSGAWTCLDEIGTNNAVSAGNMTNSDIVDGPGYSASGLGTSSIDIKGDAPYSSANGLSENMDVLDRVTDIPS